MHETKHT